MKKIFSGVLIFVMSVPMSLIPASVHASTTLFSDGFEVGTAFSAWDSSDSKWSVGGSQFHSGSKSSQAEGSTGGSDDNIVKTISTVGYQNIVLGYWYKSSNLSGGDYVKAQWSADGTTWNTLFTISSNASSWTNKSHTLPAGAENISTLKIRFTAKLSSGSHRVYLDDVSVVADEIPVVVDNAPTLTVTPSSQTLEATSGAGAAAIFTISAIDDIDGDITGSVTCDQASGSVFPLGTTNINCIVTDSGSHTVNASASVTVQDTTPPVITLVGSTPVLLLVGETYSEGGAWADDIVDGNDSVVVGGATVDTNTPGSYVVTYNAVDNAGNHAVEVTRTVVVSEEETTTVTLSDVTVEATSASGAVVNYGDIVLPDDDEVIYGTCSPASGTTFAIGTTLVTCTGIDLSDGPDVEIVGTFNVIVVDTTAPVITLLGDSEVHVTAGYAYTDAGATAFDTVDGDITSEIVTVNTVDVNTPGTYTITYNVVDSHGNHATEVTRTVVVCPVEEPTPTPTPTPTEEPTPTPTPTEEPTPTPTPTEEPTPTPTPEDNSNGGGGSGTPAANGPVAGSFGGFGGQVLGAYISSENSGQGEVLGDSCGLYMNQYLRIGSGRNNPEQVTKLQQFLNKHLGTNIPLTGYFGQITLGAVKNFQAKYFEDILQPWGESNPTGLVYISTLMKINKIECHDLAESLPELVPWSQNPEVQ